MKRLFLTVATIVLLLTITALGVLGTEGGNRWLIQTAVARYVPALTIEDIQGSLLGTLHVSGIHYQEGGLSVDADHAAVDAELLPLLGGRVLINELQIGRLGITVVGEEQTGDRQGDPDLPVFLKIDEARLAAIVVSVDGSDNIFDDVTVANLEGQEQLQLGQLAFTLVSAGLSANVSGNVGLTADLPMAFDFDWRMGDFAGAGRATGNLDSLAVGHTLSQPVSLQTEATLGLKRGLVFDAVTHWERLTWMLPDLGELESSQGSVRARGSLDGARVSGTAGLSIAGRDLNAELNGEATLSRFDIQVLSISSAGSVLKSAGSVSWDPAVNWELQLDGQALDPALLWPDWPGKLSFKGIFGGRITDAGPIWSLKTLRVDGVLHDQKLTASGELSGDASSLQLHDVTGSVADNRLAVNGDVAEQVSLDFNFNAADLGVFDASLGGHIRGEGRLEGPRARPALKGRFTGDGLNWNELRVGKLRVNAALGSEIAAPFELDIAAETIETPVTTFTTANLTTRGTPAKHVVNLTAEHERRSATLAARGGLEGRRWTGNLEQLDLLTPPGKGWQMPRPALLVFAPGEMGLEGLCLRQDESALCIDVSIIDSQLMQLQGTLNSFDLAQLKPWLGDAWSLNGVYNAEVVASQNENGIVTDAEVRGETTSIAFEHAGREPLSGQIQSLHAIARMDAEQANLTLQVAGTDEDHMSLDLKLLEPGSGSTPLDGRVDIAWRDLGLLSMIVPELDMAGALLNANAVLSGTPDTPLLSGSATLSDARFIYPPLGIALEGLEVTVTSDDRSLLELEARARAGEGELRLSGHTDLQAETEGFTRLRLRGAATPLIQLPDLELALEPEMDIDIQWPEVRVTGKANVPTARFVLNQLPANAIKPLPETVVHDSDSAATRKREERVLAYADLELTLGDDVRYSAMGLEGTVSGALHLLDAPNRTPQANGILLLNGRYGFYGQDLTISGGQLLFSGPIDDPMLDVKATRKTGDVTAGVRLFGLASAPETELFSEPAMNDSDALSYLLFGRPLSSSGADTATLDGAAVALGVVSALPISSKAQSSLGLDELTVDTGTYGTSAIMAGKQIAPDIYVRYTYGLFDRLGGLSVLYQLNEKLGVEARSAQHHSIEVTYTLKRD